jgi:hypothetical protein
MRVLSSTPDIIIWNGKSLCFADLGSKRRYRTPVVHIDASGHHIHPDLRKRLYYCYYIQYHSALGGSCHYMWRIATKLCEVLNTMWAVPNRSADLHLQPIARASQSEMEL